LHCAVTSVLIAKGSWKKEWGTEVTFTQSEGGPSISCGLAVLGEGCRGVLN